MSISTNEYAHLVPTDLDKNLEWKIKTIEASHADAELAQELYIACSRDILFYIKGFIWTYNPRENPVSPEVPFIPYPFQEKAIYDMLRAIEEKKDVVIEKSRYMGASWICLLVIDWLWRFRPLQSFLLVSRKEDLVDKAGDPQSLFWKLDYIDKRLPYFLKVNKIRNKMLVKNVENESIISGESTTGDVARGDRRTAILLDEFAAFEIQDGYRALSATQHATNTRIINSTTAGTGNAYYDMCMKALQEPEAIVHIRLGWYDHPLQRRGLYTSEDGKLKIIDTSYKFPEDYPFILDGKLRSPYYDKECRRCAHPIDIARQLDMDHMGANLQFFESSLIQNYITKYARPPVVTCEIRGDMSMGIPAGFITDPKGRFKFWDDRFITTPPKDNTQIVFGIDIASGTGASNSVISIGTAKEVVTDNGTRLIVEKIGEFTDPDISPEDFAVLVVATARWFNNAYIIWEAGGAGRPFGKKVLDKGYTNVYFKQDIDKIKHSPFSGIPGWWTTKENKRIALTDYREALKQEAFINPSQPALEECLCYIYMQGGKIEHVNSLSKTSPADSEANHGDRVIADALLYYAARDIILPIIVNYNKEKDQELPFGCIAKRRQEYQKQKADMAVINYLEDIIV